MKIGWDRRDIVEVSVMNTCGVTIETILACECLRRSRIAIKYRKPFRAICWSLLGASQIFGAITRIAETFDAVVSVISSRRQQ